MNPKARAVLARRCLHPVHPVHLVHLVHEYHRSDPPDPSDPSDLLPPTTSHFPSIRTVLPEPLLLAPRKFPSTPIPPTSYNLSTPHNPPQIRTFPCRVYRGRTPNLPPPRIFPHEHRTFSPELPTPAPVSGPAAASPSRAGSTPLRLRPPHPSLPSVPFREFRGSSPGSILQTPETLTPPCVPSVPFVPFVLYVLSWRPFKTRKTSFTKWSKTAPKRSKTVTETSTMPPKRSRTRPKRSRNTPLFAARTSHIINIQCAILDKTLPMALGASRSLPAVEMTGWRQRFIPKQMAPALASLCRGL